MYKLTLQHVKHPVLGLFWHFKLTRATGEVIYEDETADDCNYEAAQNCAIMAIYNHTGIKLQGGVTNERWMLFTGNHSFALHDFGRSPEARRV